MSTLLETESGKTMFETGGSAGINSLEERRFSRRLRESLTAKLIGLGASDVISGDALDVSEGGVFVHLPYDSGVRVGQRYEVMLSCCGATGRSSDLANCLGESCYATVVRTELLLKSASPGLGAGMRFDQPLFF